MCLPCGNSIYPLDFFNTAASVIIVQEYLFKQGALNIFTSALRSTLSMLHQGEILQEAIKNSGISITRIVEELGITRPTIYRKFKDEIVDYSFVKRVGDIINHDFSSQFIVTQQSILPLVTSLPKLPVTNSVPSRVTPTISADSDPSKQLVALQIKYIALLEAYNELLLKVYGLK